MKNRNYRYIAEFNRAIYDNIRLAANILRKLGLSVQLVPHKTTLIIERPETITWAAFRRAIVAALQPRRGSVVIFSQYTGRSYLCSNQGNQPGQFQLI